MEVLTPGCMAGEATVHLLPIVPLQEMFSSYSGR